MKIKELILYFLVNIIRKIRGYGWYGNYKNWEKARLKTTGYSNRAIIEKIKESSLKVKNGEAIYERDGVLFDKIEYSLPLLSGLLYGVAVNKRLKILDFGGSLGTSYYQSKKIIDRLNIDIKWAIVEQKDLVDIGKKEFENNILKFYYDIEKCLKEIEPEILILSVVLQYIEKPYELLDKLLNYDFNIIIIDNIPFLDNKDKDDIIKIQIVPKNIYKASYPSWIFNENKIIAYFKNRGYEIIEIFDGHLNSYVKYGNFTFKSILMEKGRK